MIDQKIAQYKILEKLGEGGMGVVYKALDTKLDRTVALKFLPHGLTSNEAERARFLQEAKAAAALNHPNVCSVIDIQEADGHQFIVMEYVDGTTLRKKVEHAKRPGGAGLSIDDAITYAIQIGEALQEAHAKNIVHRDVKSENIMVNTKNQIKVMDFGLAKLKGTLKLTRTSSTVGTLAYMAPEQIKGSDVDARSDIFSFGIVLFEMLTGQMAFRGEHEAAVMYSIVNEEPIPLTTFRPDASPELMHVIGRALEKDPADRYQTAADMVIDLRRLKRDSTRVSSASMASIPVQKSEQNKSIKAEPRLKSWFPIAAGTIILFLLAAGAFFFFRGGGSTTGNGSGKNRLAVLPFENMGPAEQEYFADGITEEVTSRLSGLSGLAVIARTSAMQYKKSTKTVKEIGNELGVDYVLQGTIRWAPSGNGTSRVRVNPALIKVGDGTQVWSQPFDAEVADAFKLQSDIAGEVVSALGLTLAQNEKSSLTSKPTENADAYDLYLRANQYNRRSYQRQDFETSVQLYQKAVDLDPHFVLAWARLSEAHSGMYWFHYDHTDARLAQAKAAVDKALAIDPSSLDGHFALGQYYYWGHLDYENALKEFSIVEQGRPNDGRLLLSIGAVYRRQGKMHLALDEMKKATEFDPRSGELSENLAQTYRLLRMFPESEQAFNRAIELRPDNVDDYTDKCQLYFIWDIDTKRARSTINDALQVSGGNQNPTLINSRILVALYDGKYDEALSIATSPSYEGFESQYVYHPRFFQLAIIYNLLKQPEKSRAYYDSSLVFLGKKVKEQPEDARYHSTLGLVLAGLGRRDEALREGKRGVELLPTTKEAWRGTYRLYELAKIEALAGQPDAAIDQLKELLSQPTDFSANLLRKEPAWAGLKSNPRFQQLLSPAQ